MPEVDPEIKKKLIENQLLGPSIALTVFGCLQALFGLGLIAVDLLYAIMYGISLLSTPPMASMESLLIVAVMLLPLVSATACLCSGIVIAGCAGRALQTQSYRLLRISGVTAIILPPLVNIGSCLSLGFCSSLFLIFFTLLGWVFGGWMLVTLSHPDVAEFMRNED